MPSSRSCPAASTRPGDTRRPSGSSARDPHASTHPMRFWLGPRGVGKTTLALDLAAGLLCLADDPATRPCRACPACGKVATSNHPDLHSVEPEGAGEQIRIGQIQSLASDLRSRPWRDGSASPSCSSAQRMNPDAAERVAQDARGARTGDLPHPLRRRCGATPAHGPLDAQHDCAWRHRPSRP